ncbi:endonuclease/exonuclease/phosphatase family protein [Saccharibacillus deserti]|uniref:endonuclease/exonuclease/phosphatase family protein n=1 Tax=Saccharibacillus deserti TaxID=1634444 RepID=UPI0015519243|nr:endonuclease/exonuclease/phosphatase family protein [Saccharibacillus deserti]
MADEKNDLNVLFWNVKVAKENSNNGQDSRSKRLKAESDRQIESIIKALKELDTQHKFDLIILAECNNKDVRDRIETELFITQSKQTKNSMQDKPSKVAIFHRLNSDMIDPTEEVLRGRYTLLPITMPKRRFLLTAVHLPAQYNTPHRVLKEMANKTKHEIFRYVSELEIPVDGIIVAGDFNMDPFDTGMVDNDSFDTTMDLASAVEVNTGEFDVFVGGKVFEMEDSSDCAVIEGTTVVVKRRKTQRFYNPSWSLHGGIEEDAAQGTYYKESGANNNIKAHMLDQVVFTSNLNDYFDYNAFEIVTRYNETKEGSLIDKHKHPKSKSKKHAYSDHLPIRFRFSFEGI